MAALGKKRRGNFLVVLTDHPEEEYHCRSTRVITVQDREGDEIWDELMLTCSDSEYFFIYVKDKAGFFENDDLLRYDIAEMVRACHKDSAELFGLQLQDKTFFYQDECVKIYREVEDELLHNN